MPNFGGHFRAEIRIERSTGIGAKNGLRKVEILGGITHILVPRFRTPRSPRKSMVRGLSNLRNSAEKCADSEVAEIGAKNEPIIWGEMPNLGGAL